MNRLNVWFRTVAGGVMLFPLISCGGGGGGSDAPSLVDLSPSGPTVGEIPAAAPFCDGDRRTQLFTGEIFERTSSVATCDPGALTPEAAQFLMDRVNFLRSLHALPPVTLNSDLLLDAQQAALMTLANDGVNHDPPSNFRCFSESGLRGARASNLSGGPLLGFGSLPDELLLTRQVDIYMAEPGLNNFTDVGHRRWMLFPQYSEGAFGIAVDPVDGGSFNQANANWVLSFDPEIPDPEVGFVAFPERDGYLFRLAGFSGQPLSAYRWSFSVTARGDEADLSGVQIRITDLQTGEQVPVSDIQEGDPSFGLATVTYTVGVVQPNREYQFDITGAIVNGELRSYQYRTTLFECGVESTELREDPNFGEALDIDLGPPPTLN